MAVETSYSLFGRKFSCPSVDSGRALFNGDMVLRRWHIIDGPLARTSRSKTPTKGRVCPHHAFASVATSFGHNVAIASEHTLLWLETNENGEKTKNWSFAPP